MNLQEQRNRIKTLMGLHEENPLAPNSSQIKLTDGRNTTFNPDDPNIENE